VTASKASTSQTETWPLTGFRYLSCHYFVLCASPAEAPSYINPGSPIVTQRSAYAVCSDAVMQ
jgi:hypothetical protein